MQKTSLLDFPGKVAAIAFTQGCNFRCGYCHNPSLIHNKNEIEFSEIEFLNFLKNRVGKLDGVVITGGEPTLQKDLYSFICKIKQLGFAVKLDTNGTNPKIISNLINDNLLDYIAMDIKAPIDKYTEVSGINFSLDNELLDSINIIINSKIDYEFRTTVIKSQLSFDDFDKIGQLINGAKRYYIQKFIPSNIYNKNLLCESTYSNDEFDKICLILKKYINNVSFR